MQTARVERPTPATATIGEVATSLGIARSTAYELAASDRLPFPVIRLGRRMVVARAALDRVLAGESAPGFSPHDEGV